MPSGITVGIVPLGEIPDIIPKIISANFLTGLNLRPEILPPVSVPEYAYDPGRMQYNAGSIIQALEKADFGKPEKIIAVCSFDLFIPIFTHVFGEARLDGKAAVISLCRLGRSPLPFPPSLLCERAVKLAVHECGHLFGLPHCQDRKCLMRFSGNPGELDEIRMDLCRYCLGAFKSRTQVLRKVFTS